MHGGRESKQLSFQYNYLVISLNKFGILALGAVGKKKN